MVNDRIHIFCNSHRPHHERSGRQEIETFARTRTRWKPDPPLRSRQRSGDWSQGRHPSSERIIDAAQHVYRVEIQRMPARYSNMSSVPGRADDPPGERLITVYIDTRSGREIEFDDIPRIDHRRYAFECPCGIQVSVHETILNRALDSWAEDDQETISLEFIAMLPTEGY